jgi:uncharacterized cupin superfamily protein
MNANPPIINLDQLEFSLGRAQAEHFEFKMAPVANRVGAKKLGYNVTRVPPGKRAFPFHSHHANEEMFFILEGTGRLRFGSHEHAVRKGDFIACPTGGAEVAHQLINDGAADLLYLAVSTRNDTDVWSYPDSGKVGAVGGVQYGGTWPPPATFPAKFYVEGAEVDYWHGEPGVKPE